MDTQKADTGFVSTAAAISNNAREYPDQVAMRQKKHGIWQETTWAELEDITNACAAALIELGVQRLDKVGILGENRAEWVQAQFGAWAAGATVAGMYPTSPAPEIDHLASASDTSVLFVEDQEQLDKILELEGKLPLLRQLIVIDPKGCQGIDYLNLTTWDDFLAKGRAALANGALDEINARRAALQPDDTALMIFTSGSTGLPKAAEITFGNLYGSMNSAHEVFEGYKPGTNVLSYLPLCHIAEQAVTVLNALTCKFVMNFGESLRTVTPDLRDVAPEIFFGVPRIWERMQASVMVQAQTAGPIRSRLTLRALAGAVRRGKTRRDSWGFTDRVADKFWDLLIYRHIRSYLGLGHMTFGVTAAAPISEELLAFLRGIGLNVREAWGMSESSGLATIQPDWGGSDGRVGIKIDSLDVKIADDGEILVKGPTIFKGYFKNPSATEEAFSDGWFHTGDVGQFEPDGSMTLIDRKKDIMINAAGKNLSPAYIENVIKSSSYIKECIMIADKRPYATALVVIDMETVRLWAENNGIAYTTFRSLAENQKVIELIDQEVANQNANLARVEQLKKVYLLPKELDHDDGEVTATMKVRRAKIYDLYAPEIEALYG